MQLLTFLTLAVTATAAAIPDAAIEERNTACSTTPSAALAAAKAAFTNAKLVPDLIASFNPTVAVSANYNGKQVSLGNTFSVTGEFLGCLSKCNLLPWHTRADR